MCVIHLEALSQLFPASVCYISVQMRAEKTEGRMNAAPISITFSLCARSPAASFVHLLPCYRGKKIITIPMEFNNAALPMRRLMKRKCNRGAACTSCANDQRQFSSLLDSK